MGERIKARSWRRFDGYAKQKESGMGTRLRIEEYESSPILFFYDFLHSFVFAIKKITFLFY